MCIISITPTGKSKWSASCTCNQQTRQLGDIEDQTFIPSPGQTLGMCTMSAILNFIQGRKSLITLAEHESCTRGPKDEDDCEQDRR